MNDFISPEQLVELVPGTTKGYWAQLRFTGKGPRFYKPSAKVVLYSPKDVNAWIEDSARQGTALSAV